MKRGLNAENNYFRASKDHVREYYLLQITSQMILGMT